MKQLKEVQKAWNKCSKKWSTAQSISNKADTLYGEAIRLEKESDALFKKAKDLRKVSCDELEQEVQKLFGNVKLEWRRDGVYISNGIRLGDLK